MKRILKRGIGSCENWWVSRGGGRLCELCKWTGKRFLTHGAPQKRRFDARCPRCSSLERHRLAYKVINQFAVDLLPPRMWRVLHVAPEDCVEPWLRREAKYYLSIDKYGPAMQAMDLTKLELDDRSFDFIWCSHVLEHIEADQRAMQEMFRVLDGAGVLLAQVPIWRLETYEDFSIQSETQRLQHFFQRDHVRLYGLDIVNRLTNVGFEVHVFHAREFGPAAVTQGALSYLSTNEVYVCRRPAAS